MEFCAEVCKQGSVVLSSWLTKTIKYQVFDETKVDKCTILAFA